MHELPVIKLGGLNIDLSTFVTIIVSSLIVFVVARLAVRNLSVDNPSKMQNFMEWAAEFVRNIVASTMPLKHGKAYVSLGLTLITFIFVSNLLGLPFGFVTEHTEPVTVFGQTLYDQEYIDEQMASGHENGIQVSWWKSPTADLSVTLGLALVVFLTIHFMGLKKNTKGYLKQYFEPYWFFLPLNIISEIFKPITLGIRLYANIFAGEILVATIVMAGFLGIPFMMAWQGFSIFIGAIQAFLFTILTMVYIGQATVNEES